MMWVFIFISAVIIIFLGNVSYSQQTKAGNPDKDKKSIFDNLLPKGFTISAYIDTYAAYDTDKGEPLRKFSAIAPYRDEFRLNMISLGIRYSKKRVRGNFVVQFGDIPKVNWPVEPNYIKYIQEVNGGFSPKKGLWIEGGFFFTHIGGEGGIPRYNYFQSMALCTYFEPLYQSGLRVSYTGKKFYGSVMALQGYNMLIDNNKNKSFALQLGYKLGKNVEMTYNNIAGNEMPEGEPFKMRLYNNLVTKIYAGKKTEIIVTVDHCLQQKSKLADSTKMAHMFSGFASVKHKAAKRFYIMARGEFFYDKDGILSGEITTDDASLTGLKAIGFTAGVEYNPYKNSYVRLESRFLYLDKKQTIFSNSKNYRTEVILSGGIEF